MQVKYYMYYLRKIRNFGLPRNFALSEAKENREGGAFGGGRKRAGKDFVQYRRNSVPSRST